MVPFEMWKPTIPVALMQPRTIRDMQAFELSPDDVSFPFISENKTSIIIKK